MGCGRPFQIEIDFPAWCGASFISSENFTPEDSRFTAGLQQRYVFPVGLLRRFALRPCIDQVDPPEGVDLAPDANRSVTRRAEAQ